MEVLFYTKDIPMFTSKTGMKVKGQFKELKDGRKGFVLGANWKEEIETKTEVEFISKNDLKQDI